MSPRHRRIQRSIDAYVDGELNAEHCDAIADHLDDCPGCTRIERQILRIKESLRRTATRRIDTASIERLGRFGRSIGD